MAFLPTTTTTNTLLNPPQPPLPPLNTLVRPEYIKELFRTNEQQSTFWHGRVTRLWHVLQHHPENAKRQLAHQKLARMTQVTRDTLDRHRRKLAARQAEQHGRQSEASAQQAGQPPAVGVGFPQPGSTTAPGEIDFIHLDGILFEHRFCTMCKHPYCVKEVDGEASFRHYPVRFSCRHLLCFGCAKVLLRMYLNCTSCGRSFGHGKAELVKIEAQIQLFGQRFRDGKLGSVEAGNAQSLGGGSDAVVGDGTRLTREDVEAALALLNLAGKKFSMGDVHAGLALLDPRAGTDKTLEDYLLAISRQ